MKQILPTLLLSLGVVISFSSCGARVVAFRHAPGATVVAAQSIEKADPEVTLEPGIEPLVESTAPSEDEFESVLVAEPPAFLAESPAGENSGPVSILIDAPEGSTATYSLDRDDPIESPLSFAIENVSPGDHVLEIVVQYPNGNTITFEHHWTQVAEAAAEKSNHPSDSKKKKKDRKEKQKKDRGASEKAGKKKS